MTVSADPAVLLREAETVAREQGVDRWTSTMRVLVARLELVSEKLAGPVPDALGFARRVWVDGTEPAGLLDDRRAALWDFLRDNGAELSWSWIGRSTRCALAVLEPGGDDDLRHDLVEWFCVYLYRWDTPGLDPDATNPG